LAKKTENGGMSKTTIFLNQDSLTDLFTLVFVLVDDYLIVAQREAVFELPKAQNQKGSYSELMTIALVGELLKQRYNGNWFEFVKVEYRQLFPELPDKTRFYRIQNHLERIYADFALRFPPCVITELSSYVIDSKALPICKGVRWTRPRKMTEATSGRASLGKFFGFKLHAVTDPQGCICRFAIVPAHEADPTVARALLQETSAFVLGDKAYQGCGVYAQPKDNFLKPRLWSSAFAWVRKTIETVFSSLTRSRNLTLVQLNSFRSIRTAVCRKIAAHNLAYFLLH
jgi:transposase